MQKQKLSILIQSVYMLIQRMLIFVKCCLLYSHVKSTTAAYKLSILTANPEQ